MPSRPPLDSLIRDGQRHLGITADGKAGLQNVTSPPLPIITPRELSVALWDSRGEAMGELKRIRHPLS